MNISITSELENFINAKVKSGMYNSASEVVREALRMLAEEDEMRKNRLEKLRAEIQVGLDQVERGEVFSAEEVEARLDKLFKKYEN